MWRFQEGDEIRFEYEVEKGQTICPSVRAKWTNGLTEYVIRTGQPLLIRSDLEEDPQAAERHLHSARAPAKMFLRSTHFPGRKTRWRHGGAEHRTRICVRAARSGSYADCSRPGFGGGGKCAPVRRRATPFAPACVPQQYFQDRYFQRRFGTDAGGDCGGDPEELPFRSHRHRHFRLRHQRY